MKFLTFLVLPCFLTLGATSFPSSASANILSESIDSSVTLNASNSTSGTARRGSGRGTGRRQILAQNVVVQTSL